MTEKIGHNKIDEAIIADILVATVESPPKYIPDIPVPNILPNDFIILSKDKEKHVDLFPIIIKMPDVIETDKEDISKSEWAKVEQMILSSCPLFYKLLYNFFFLHHYQLQMHLPYYQVCSKNKTENKHICKVIFSYFKLILFLLLLLFLLF